MPAPTSELLPLDRLGPYLKEKMGVGDIHDAIKTASGQSNPTFVLKTDIGPLVVRRKPPGPLLKSAHAVEREYRVMAALAGHLPVPKMHHLCTAPEVIGAVFFVMAYVDGACHVDPALPEVSVRDRAATYDAMNAGLAQLHGLDPEALGLGDYGRPGNYFGRQLARWTDQYRATATEDQPALDRLIDWLAKAMPEDDGRVALVHGDWRIDNLLFDPAAHHLVAVLDWELSTLGHPLADLGTQMMQWAMPTGPDGRGLAGVDRASLGIPSDAAYVAAYEARVGRSVPDMRFYVAFAFFRMAAILQGVKKRALDGNASNRAAALRLGAYVPLLAERAWEKIGSSG